MAIIVQSGIKLVRTTVGKDCLLWAIFAVLAITTAWTKSEIVWLFVLCGLITMLIKVPRVVGHTETRRELLMPKNFMVQLWSSNCF